MSVDPREVIGESLGGLLDRETVNAIVKDVLETKKRARGWCEHCGRAVYVEITDTKAVTSALTDLLSQGYGRAPEAPKKDPEPVELEIRDLSALSDDELRKIAGAS